jgi:hypothetical protein
VEKLLLTPTEQLKSLGDADTVGAYAETLRRLFALSDEAGEAAAIDQDSAVGRVEPFIRAKGRGTR